MAPHQLLCSTFKWSIARFLFMVTYSTPYFQHFHILFKERLLTTTTLLLLEGSVKVAKGISAFIPYCLFLGHRSCRQPRFKLRLSITTELSVLVVTSFRGQRSHLGHSFSTLTLFHIFHWGQFHEGFSSSQGLCVPLKAVSALFSMVTNMLYS